MDKIAINNWIQQKSDLFCWKYSIAGYSGDERGGTIASVKFDLLVEFANLVGIDILNGRNKWNYMTIRGNELYKDGWVEKKDFSGLEKKR